MVREFRALGGTVENVRLGDGPLGRGLFPIDDSKSIHVHIPESLLLETRYARIEDGVFRIVSEAPVGPRARAFLEAYERDVSWGVGHQHAKGLLQMIQQAPTGLRNFLDNPLHVGHWLVGPSEQAIIERLFSSRVYYKYKDQAVIMPIVELANHGPGTHYENQDGLSLSGQFLGEVLVRYQSGDPLDLFENWGFISGGEPFARSLAMRMETSSGPLVIMRNPLPAAWGKTSFVPELFVEEEQVTLSNVLLGHKHTPALPRNLFYRVMADAGLGGAAEMFEAIQHIKRLQFYTLDALSESAAPALGAILRDLARHQLEAMSHCIGAGPM